MKLLLLSSMVLGASANSAPIAPHLLFTVSAGEEAVFSLPGYDEDGDALTATIESLSETGAMSQLSQVYNDYGYDPKTGTALAVGDAVTGSKNRLVYTRPTPDSTTVGEFDSFTYTVSDGTETSDVGIVRVVHAAETLVETDFYSDEADWTVVGNRASSETPTHEAASRGLLNHYVYATDNDIHVDKSTGSDQARWFFQAPEAFLGQQGLSYGGSLDFLLSSFSGDFSAANRNGDLEFVVLECAQCDVNKGVRLVRFLDDDLSFAGTTTQFSLDLTEDAGWLVDPENTNLEWEAPSQCTMIEVLSGLSNVSILGDHTRWYESVALDAVQLKHGDGLPICAQLSADASVCSC